MQNKKIIYFLTIIFLFILFLVSYNNFYYENMSMRGIILNNYITIFVIAYFFYKKEFLDFLCFNWLLGPFLFLNLQRFNIYNLGRLDYIIYFILFFYIKKNIRINMKFLLINLLIIFSIIIYQGCSIKTFDTLYAVEAKIAAAFLLSYLLKSKQKIKNNFIIILYILHIVFSYIQFFYPIYLRQSTIEAKIIIGNIVVNRSLGFLPNSYTYGVITLFLFYLITRNRKIKCFNLILTLILVPVCISTRSVGLAIILYFIFIKMKKNKIITKYNSFFLIIIIIIFFWNLKNIIILLDSSNRVKLSLWYITLTNYLENISIVSFFIGNGKGSSTLMAQNLASFTKTINIYLNDSYLFVEKFPIHNVYIEMLYEYGYIVFSFYLFNIVKILKKIKNYSMDNLIIIVLIINYFLHNGIFNEFLLGMILYFSRKDVKLWYQ